MVRIELRGQVIGQASWLPDGFSSIAMFCPCGELWARLHRGPKWYVIRQECEKCGSGTLFGNFDWYGGAAGFRRILSENQQVLRYEFWAAMGAAEKGRGYEMFPEDWIASQIGNDLA